ncbi:unnamed protein product [Adineta ricciae]|uniref:Uncharacterized protein n=1 Tax=Adineta ricciae TaxID=249248 RepID=A0A814KNQ3_ADIRI|nr:unnamed protein product [Adineta ricciae]CAF1418707.1 unnamed protein product [Adineta ricciae]
MTDCKSKWTSFLICLLSLSVLFFVPCVVIGSIYADSYSKDRKTQGILTETTCLVLNYTYYEHTCSQCSYDSSSYEQTYSKYTCVDEYFSLSYPIHNGTSITSTYTTKSRAGGHRPIKIGQNHSCYYHSNHVSSITLDFPSTKLALILLCICFGIIGVICVLPLICLTLMHGLPTSCEHCSYVSNMCVSVRNTCTKLRKKIWYNHRT